MKTCTKCNEEKPLSEFSFRNISEQKYQAQCKTCIAQRDKDSYNTESRKLSIRKAAKSSQERAKQFLIDYKEEKGCCKCGDKRHYVLDFHHERDKEYDVATGVYKGMSTSRLMEEINKCVVICANCHRELHHLERMEINSVVEY